MQNVAQTFMLACTSFGLATCPMEGFDAWKVKEVCKIPSYYKIPLIVSVGYAAQPHQPQPQQKEETERKDYAGNETGTMESSKKKSFRYPVNEVCFEDHFGCELKPAVTSSFSSSELSIPSFSL